MMLTILDCRIYKIRNKKSTWGRHYAPCVYAARSSAQPRRSMVHQSQGRLRQWVSSNGSHYKWNAEITLRELSKVVFAENILTWWWMYWEMNHVARSNWRAVEARELIKDVEIDGLSKEKDQCIPTSTKKTHMTSSRIGKRFFSTKEMPCCLCAPR